MVKFAKYFCMDCKAVFVASSTRHTMDYCPSCRETYVDMEEEYTRASITAKWLENFEAPWFDDEDEYHSALMSWLNDGDDIFELNKKDGVLYVIKMPTRNTK